VVWWKCTNVLEVLAALIMEAARTSETLVNFTRLLHGATTQKTAIFVFKSVVAKHKEKTEEFR
jgi:hypothetical protein